MFTLAGTALYIRLWVYTGLSLFIIRRANVYLVVCVLTRITLQYNYYEIQCFRTKFTGKIQRFAYCMIKHCRRLFDLLYDKH